MAWIELHQSLPQHRKLLALRDALGLRTPAALGHMCLLWLWALDNAPDGDLSALPARQLAAMVADASVKPELRLKAAGMVLGHERGKAAPAKDEGAAEPEVLRFEGALEQWSR